MAATATQRGKSQANLLHRGFSSPVLKPWGSPRLFRCDSTDGGDHRSALEIGSLEDDGGLDELREKLLGHLRDAADKMKLDVVPLPSTSTAAEATIPWNLRTRRAPQARASLVPEKKETQRLFSISLSKEEIEEDVFALTGSRPRRRPKKRPRNVQKQLDSIFPGLWLSEISPESYRVPE